MRKLRIAEKGVGLHPNERIVEIQTVEGPQELVIHARSILADGFIDVGFPIRESGNDVLVELPRETSGGAWRVWVGKSEVAEHAERQHA